MRSTTDLVVKVLDSVTDLRGNNLADPNNTATSSPVTVDTVNPTVRYYRRSGWHGV